MGSAALPEVLEESLPGCPARRTSLAIGRVTNCWIPIVLPLSFSPISNLRNAFRRSCLNSDVGAPDVSFVLFFDLFNCGINRGDDKPADGNGDFCPCRGT